MTQLISSLSIFHCLYLVVYFMFNKLLECIIKMYRIIKMKRLDSNSRKGTKIEFYKESHLFARISSYATKKERNLGLRLFLKNFLLHFCSTLPREVIFLLTLPVLGLVLPQVWLRVALSLWYEHYPNTWRREHRTIDQGTPNSDAYRVMLNEKEIMKLHSMMPI